MPESSYSTLVSPTERRPDRGVGRSPDGWPVGGMRKPLIPRLDEVLSTHRVGIGKRARIHANLIRDYFRKTGAMPTYRYRSGSVSAWVILCSLRSRERRSGYW